MRARSSVALAALVGTTLSACGGSTSAGPLPPTSTSRFAVPVGAPPIYLGPVTSAHAIPNQQATIAPPPKSVTPKLSWPELRSDLCHEPGGTRCSDPHLRIVARLGILHTKSFWSPNIPANGLVYYVTSTGIRCNTIAVSSPIGGQRKPWPTWCQSSGFINAETGVHIGGGVGPMPGQQ